MRRESGHLEGMGCVSENQAQGGPSSALALTTLCSKAFEKSPGGAGRVKDRNKKATAGIQFIISEALGRAQSFECTRASMKTPAQTAQDPRAGRARWRMATAQGVDRLLRYQLREKEKRKGGLGDPSAHPLSLCS